MSKKLVPRSMWSFPSIRLPFTFDDSEDGEWLQDLSDLSGLAVSEDENSVYVEAAVPGVKPEEVEVTFDKGILWIKAEKKEETEGKAKKYYRKATSTFSYRVAVPGNIDESRQPDATIKNGMIKIIFSKTQKSQPKKIPIKSGT